MVYTDILIIGAGITGTAVAQSLSRYDASICVVDSACDIAEGATKANSGIVHAGYDAIPGTLKARYNVRGSAMYPQLCKRLGVPYARCGALIVALSPEDIPKLNELLERGRTNGVDGLRIIDREELLDLEPNLNHDVAAALLVPSSAIVSPYELAFALADEAAVNGTRFFFNEPVQSIVQINDTQWKVETDANVFICRALINCAGSSGAKLHNMISEKKLSFIHRRGQYYLLDRTPNPPFSHTIFQCPTHRGKGVLVSPTVHGNVLIGPNAEDIPDPLDTQTTSEGLAEVFSKARLTWPALSARTNITNFSGVRAHPISDDFIVGSLDSCPGAFEAIGIESPGLSSAPAIAEDLSTQVAMYLSLKMKNKIVSLPPRNKPFHEMDDDERRKAVTANPLYGKIICRCETVTEAEIRDAIHRPVGATTIDGIKRRTRAGMGRCQGGFCSPRVASILAEELRVPITEITKNGGTGHLLVGTVGDFLKAGESNDYTAR